MVLVCNGFVDGFPETQTALLDKMEGYLNHTRSEEFQKEYANWSVILRVTLGPAQQVPCLGGGLWRKAGI